MVSTGPSISNRSCWSFLACFWCSFGAVLVQFWCSFGAVRSRHRHCDWCDWEIRRLECQWSPTLWPKTWQHTLRRFRHSKSPAFLGEMICHVWPLVWYVLINDDQWWSMMINVYNNSCPSTAFQSKTSTGAVAPNFQSIERVDKGFQNIPTSAFSILSALFVSDVHTCHPWMTRAMRLDSFEDGRWHCLQRFSPQPMAMQVVVRSLCISSLPALGPSFLPPATQVFHIFSPGWSPFFTSNHNMSRHGQVFGLNYIFSIILSPGCGNKMGKGSFFEYFRPPCEKHLIS